MRPRPFALAEQAGCTDLSALNVARWRWRRQCVPFYFVLTTVVPLWWLVSFLVLIPVALATGVVRLFVCLPDVMHASRSLARGGGVACLSGDQCPSAVAEGRLPAHASGLALAFRVGARLLAVRLAPGLRFCPARSAPA